MRDASRMESGITMSEPAHVLALELARELRLRPGAARVLLLGIGSGRNVPPFVEAGLHVDAIEADAERARSAAVAFAAESRVRVVRARYAGPLPVASGGDAALSTHALLHGTPSDVAAAALAAANRLKPGALFFTTLGCTDDPRFGGGTRIDARTYAPSAGSEAGVAHAYFERDDVARVLAPFSIRSLERIEAAEHAGRWAHDEGERIVHWFVRAERPHAV